MYDIRTISDIHMSKLSPHINYCQKNRGPQARDLCERPHGLVFGRAMRDDLGKLFLGKDAVAYITRRTPGPGAYELGWQRPVFLFPSRESGTTIGGPLANVDRVQTGPLGAAYRSDTPGPGAYNETDDRGIRVAPTQRSIDCKGYYSTGGRTSSWSGTDPGRASTRYIVSLSYFACISPLASYATVASVD